MNEYTYIMLYYDSNFTDVCSGNGLTPSRRQDTTCTNAEPVHWRIYMILGDELNCIVHPMYFSHVFNAFYARHATPYVFDILQDGAGNG